MSQRRSSRLHIMLLSVLALGAVGCAPMRTSSEGPGDMHACLAMLFAHRPMTPLRDARPGFLSGVLFTFSGTSMSSASNRTSKDTDNAHLGHAPLLHGATEWFGGGTIRVVRARVGAYKRIIALDDDGPNFDARAAILAREMDPRLLRGTEVTAVYDVSYRGAPDGDGPKLLALQLGNGSSAKRALRISDDEHGVDGFYTPDGHPVEARFLRYPLDFMLVTSPFSHSRRHPILKKRRPHLGVDLAAPYGTPVLAIADGDVIEASWSGGFGRTVTIRHDEEYATGYSHLGSITRGVVPGAHVRKGDVIGSVGRSGLATGPHLHFSLVRGTALVDPLATRLPQGPALDDSLLRSLRTAAAQLAQTFARADAGQAEPALVATRSHH